MSDTPTLPQIIARHINGFQRSAYTAMPARVESYDSASQKCSAQPLVLGSKETEEGTESERLPVVTNVPVVFPRAGSYSITFPIAAGDTVLLVFSSLPIDQWLALGGEVIPNAVRRNHISDAIAIPGLSSFSDAIPSSGTSGSAMVLRASEVRIGSSSANQAAIKGNAYRTAEDTLIQAFLAYAGAVSGAVPGIAAALATLTTAVTTFNTGAASYLATKVKVE